MISGQMAAREHIAWCVCRGMTPEDVCESVNAFLTRPTWPEALSIIEWRWDQIQRGVHHPQIITDRSAQ